jgi:hypothetical protein
MTYNYLQYMSEIILFFLRTTIHVKKQLYCVGMVWMYPKNIINGVGVPQQQNGVYTSH